MENILPKRLRQLCISKNMTQNNLADRLQIFSAAVSSYESGENNPTMTIFFYRIFLAEENIPFIKRP